MENSAKIQYVKGRNGWRREDVKEKGKGKRGSAGVNANCFVGSLYKQLAGFMKENTKSLV